MKPTPIARGVAAALAGCALSLPSLALFQDAPPAAPAPQGSLRRLDPSQSHEQDLKDAFTRDFDRQRWEERLTQSDLDQRERSLDALLKRARIDPVARAFLEELAKSPKGGELAWTARLALRQLGRANFPWQGFQPGADPLGSSQRMQEWMEQLFEQQGLGMMVPHSGLPNLQAPNGMFGKQGGGSSARQIQVQQSENGACVRITETIDGKEQTREFTGNSLQEILNEHRELEDELGGLSIHVQAGSPLDLQFGSGKRPGLQPFAPERDLVLPLAPQGKSRPILTDRLGVIVQPVTSERAKELGIEGMGLLVERAMPQTYAHLLGVKAGDVLIQLEDVVLHTAADIENVMKSRNADDELTLVWMDELGQRQEKTWRPPSDPKPR